VIPAPFKYLRPTSVEEAIALIAADEDAKVLAGGHSLLPIMKLRLAAPSALVDIGRIEGLAYVREEGGVLAIGAMTHHHDVATSPLLLERLPLLAETASYVGDPQVRHRGTIGGSIVHGDPASDLPAAVLALDATLVLVGPNGTRTVPASEFFLSFLETATAPDEILTEIRVPAAPGGFGFEKFTRRAQDWAIVGVAAQRRGDEVGVGLVNMSQTPVRASATEEAIRSGAGAEAAAELADEGTEPVSDQSASSEYRRHLARVLTARALKKAGF
jgi:aerobic carbon-monoxide dehydrogenase medium subunit